MYAVPVRVRQNFFSSTFPAVGTGEAAGGLAGADGAGSLRSTADGKGRSKKTSSLCVS